MVAPQEDLGPSVGPLPARAFEAHKPTAERDLDRTLQRLKEHAKEFARLPVARKMGLLQEALVGTRDIAAEWVAAGCRAKGIAQDSPVSGEEWIAGPALTLRNIR